MTDQKRTLNIPSYEAGSPAPPEVDTSDVIPGPGSDPAEDFDAEDNLDPSSNSARVRRARVNQHYNEVETGGITGIGSDDAAPLQDVDFELG
jgi:hypothetical protein